MGAFVAWRMSTKAGEIPVKLQVSRIGRRPECDVSLDTQALPDHAVSVWYEEGKYLLSNVSDRSYQLDGVPLEPRESLEWRADSTLTLAEDVTVTLRIRGNPAPSSVSGESVEPIGLDLHPDTPNETMPDAAEREQPDEDELPQWLKGLRYEYAVIIACLLIVPLVAGIGPTDERKQERRRVMELEKSVLQRLGEEHSDPRFLEIRALMARAASDRGRGDATAARQEYGQAKNLVLRLQSDAASDPRFLHDVSDVLKMHLDDLP